MVIIFLVQTTTKLLLCIEFYINQDIIAKTLCINKEKPELLCSGKCVLNTSLQKAEKNENEQSPVSQKDRQDLVWTFHSLEELVRAYEKNVEIKLADHNYNYNENYSPAYLENADDPPELV